MPYSYLYTARTNDETFRIYNFLYFSPLVFIGSFRPVCQRLGVSVD